MPTAHFGRRATSALPAIVQHAGADAAVIVTDAALAATTVVPGSPPRSGPPGSPVVFSGVQPNPSTADVAAGADSGAELAAQGHQVMLAGVRGRSAIDAAKGIALAAVNPQRGRDLGYRRQFSRPALPVAAVPTTAGTGAETNAFGVVRDPEARRKFYVWHFPGIAQRADSAVIGPGSCGRAL